MSVGKHMEKENTLKKISEWSNSYW